jgi:hypothetical protein
MTHLDLSKYKADIPTLSWAIAWEIYLTWHDAPDREEGPSVEEVIQAFPGALRILKEAGSWEGMKKMPPPGFKSSD